MKADLILVSHNSTTDLERFLPSIKEHTEDYNLIIIENGDALATGKFYGDFGAKVFFSKNNGYGAACNVGAKEGSADIIVFLNSDLLASENWLVDLLKPFEDPAVAVTGARLFNERGQEYPTPKADMAIGCCFAVRRKVFEELGGFDENFFLFFEEKDFCFRAKKAGYKIIRSEAKLIHYHPHFFPMPPELQKHYDKSQTYFKNKHAGSLKKFSLALVMIVKNEEKGLERAILSCCDFVSEIVIAVDNSSTDKTLEIAKKYATTLKHFDWQDDFAATRNFAHEGVKSDWILFLDGHEFVKECPDLENHLKTDCDGLLCTVEMESGMQFRNPRIYRNGARFEGAVHEIQNCKKMGLYLEFLVKHDRAGGQEIAASLSRTSQREEQICRIMGDRLKKSKKDVRASFHLAIHYQGVGQFKKALRMQKLFLKYSADKGQRWYILFNRALCYLSMEKLFLAFWAASRADDETPDRWEISKLRGIILLTNKKYFPALESLIGSFKINTGDVSYKPWSRDDSGTWNLIGECFFNLGQYYQAYIAFDRAAKTILDESFGELFRKRADFMLTLAKKSF